MHFKFTPHSLHCFSVSRATAEAKTEIYMHVPSYLLCLALSSLSPACCRDAFMQKGEDVHWIMTHSHKTEARFYKTFDMKLCSFPLEVLFLEEGKKFNLRLEYHIHSKSLPLRLLKHFFVDCTQNCTRAFYFMIQRNWSEKNSRVKSFSNESTRKYLNCTRKYFMLRVTSPTFQVLQLFFYRAHSTLKSQCRRLRQKLLIFRAQQFYR